MFQKEYRMKPIPPTDELMDETLAPKRRRRFTPWLWRIPLTLALCVIALGVVGALAQIIASASDSRTFPPPGRLINVGGYEMHIYCSGEGSPTVILDGASVDTVSGWHWVQTELAKSTRVCAYDRPGLGWSDLGPEPRDATQNAEQLHRLLEQAGIPGPYMLVGHSLGGLYMRVFAAHYADEVAGMALIEGTHPDFLARLGQPDVMPNADEGMLSAGPIAVRLGLFRLVTFVPADPDLPSQQQGELAAYYASTKFADRMLSIYLQFPNVLAQTRTAGDLDDKLVMVVIGAASDNATGLQRQLQDEFLTLSSKSQLRIVEEATHISLVHQADHALKTSAAIMEIVMAVRKG
jgi:pimeloyl-ACP methyl ester carboxylesterase